MQASNISPQRPLVIYGAGGLGREVLMLVRQINLFRLQWNIVGFVDDKLPVGEVVNGVPVLGDVSVLNQFAGEVWAVVACGNAPVKRKMQLAIKNPAVRYPVLVHPSVGIEAFQQISIGEGSIITAGCRLTCDIAIGSHVLLNLNSTVGHDVVIGDYCSIMPGSHLSGQVRLDEGVYLGTGAAVINNLSIGAWSVVGAGAVVIETIPAYTTAVGVPARGVNKHERL